MCASVCARATCAHHSVEGEPFGQDEAAGQAVILTVAMRAINTKQQQERHQRLHDGLRDRYEDETIFNLLLVF